MLEYAEERWPGMEGDLVAQHGYEPQDLEQVRFVLLSVNHPQWTPDMWQALHDIAQVITSHMHRCWWDGATPDPHPEHGTWLGFTREMESRLGTHYRGDTILTPRRRSAELDDAITERLPGGRLTWDTLAELRWPEIPQPRPPRNNRTIYGGNSPIHMDYEAPPQRNRAAERYSQWVVTTARSDVPGTATGSTEEE